MRAVLVGLFLFVISLISGAVSIALMRYFDQPMLGLIFPTTGVVCMFIGEKLLKNMEDKMGVAEGGAGAMFMRSTVSAMIMWLVPLLGWGGVLAMSDIVILGMEAAEMPRTVDEVVLTVSELTS